MRTHTVQSDSASNGTSKPGENRRFTLTSKVPRQIIPSRRTGMAYPIQLTMETLSNLKVLAARRGITMQALAREAIERVVDPLVVDGRPDAGLRRKRAFRDATRKGVAGSKG